MARRSIGGVAMIDRSRTPDSDICSVRGIGVAVSVRTWTSVRSSFSRSLWVTPKCCSSSMTSRPRFAKPDLLGQQRVGADDDVDRSLGQSPRGSPRRPWPGRSGRADALPEESRGSVRKSWRNAGAIAASSGRSRRPAGPTSRRRRPRASPPRSCRSPRRRRSAGPSERRRQGRSASSSMAVELVLGLLVGEAGAEGVPHVVRRLDDRAPSAAAARPRRGSGAPRCRGCAASSAPSWPARRRRRGGRAAPPRARSG